MNKARHYVIYFAIAIIAILPFITNCKGMSDVQKKLAVELMELSSGGGTGGQSGYHG